MRSGGRYGAVNDDGESVQPPPPRTSAGRRAHRRAVRKHARNPPMSEPLIVIGNGMAAARFVDELARARARPLCRRRHRRRAAARLQPRAAVRAAGRRGRRRRRSSSSRHAWWRDRGVTLRYGMRATAIDRGARSVTLADGTPAAVLQARVRHRLAADQAAHSRHGSAGRAHLPRRRRRRRPSPPRKAPATAWW